MPDDRLPRTFGGDTCVFESEADVLGGDDDVFGPSCRAAPGRGGASVKRRALATFAGRENRDYLARALAAPGMPGPPPCGLGLDDFAARNADLAAGAPDVWAGVRALNRAYVDGRVTFAARHARLVAAGESAVPYHERMFERDSLRPPGLEGLNADAPALTVDQALTAHFESGGWGHHPRQSVVHGSRFHERDIGGTLGDGMRGDVNPYARRWCPEKMWEA
jgi:hypothetical protein